MNQSNKKKENSKKDGPKRIKRPKKSQNERSSHDI